MPDPEIKADEGSPGAEGPTLEEIMAKSQEDAFGMPKADPKKSVSGDPKPPDKKPDDEKPPEGSTPKKVEKEGDGEPPREKKYAGQFDTVEALEESTKAKDTFIGVLKAENKKSRERVTALEEQIKGIEAKFTAVTPTKPTDEGKAPALTDNAEYQSMRKEFEEQFGKEAAVVMLKGFDAMVKTATGVQKDADPELIAKVNRLEAKTLEHEFEELYPDAKDEKIKEAMADLIDEAKEKFDDPMFQMSLVLGAAQARLMPELLEKKLLLRLKRMTKEEKEKLLAGSLVSGKVAGEAGTIETGDRTMRDEQKSAFGKENVK